MHFQKPPLGGPYFKTFFDILIQGGIATPFDGFSVDKISCFLKLKFLSVDVIKGSVSRSMVYFDSVVCLKLIVMLLAV
jgi:hypothetical protein